jgi:hypothetical protein
MPKIFGSSLLAILLATVAFYMLGFIWYSFLFADQWMHLTGITEADALIRGEQLGAMMYVWGVLITLLQVLGIAAVLNWAGATRLITCVKIAVMLAVMIVLPVLGYGMLYQDVSIHLVGIDFLHLLIGYSLAAVIISFFRSNDNK